MLRKLPRLHSIQSGSRLDYYVIISFESIDTVASRLGITPAFASTTTLVARVAPNMPTGVRWHYVKPAGDTID